MRSDHCYRQGFDTLRPASARTASLSSLCLSLSGQEERKTDRGAKRQKTRGTEIQRDIERESERLREKATLQVHTVRVTALAVVLHLINASADWTLRHRAKTAADAARTAGTALTTGQEAGSGQGGLSGRFVWSTLILYFSRLPTPNVCRDIDLQAWACNLIR